jgi:hypothetical protein
VLNPCAMGRVEVRAHRVIKGIRNAPASNGDYRSDDLLPAYVTIPETIALPNGARSMVRMGVAFCTLAASVAARMRESAENI